MRIIDFHTHYYPPRVAEKALAFVSQLMRPALNGTREDLEKSMDAAGIDCAATLALVNKAGNFDNILNWAQAENHGRIRMVGSIHPAQPDPVAGVRQVAAAGLPGIKVHPDYQQFNFDDERLFPIWEECAARDLFLITHAGFDVAFRPPFATEPVQLARFHRRFPELKLVLAHFGSLKMWEAVERELIGTGVYLDLACVNESEIPREKLAALIRRHGSGRVLFGTDSPWFGQKAAVEYISSLPLTSEELENIFHRNAETLLKIEGDEK